MEPKNVCRSGRHEISRPSHRRSNGHCAGCARENESKYRRSCRDARHKLRELEAFVETVKNLKMTEEV